MLGAWVGLIFAIIGIIFDFGRLANSKGHHLENSKKDDKGPSSSATTNAENVAQGQQEEFKKEQENRAAGLKELEAKLAQLRQRQQNSAASAATPAEPPKESAVGEETTTAGLSPDCTFTQFVPRPMQVPHPQEEDVAFNNAAEENSEGKEEGSKIHHLSNKTQLLDNLEKKLGKYEIFSLPLKAKRITSMEDIAPTALVLAVIFLALLIIGSILGATIPQLFDSMKGLSGMFGADVSPQYLDLLQKIDAGFSTNAPILTLIFGPMLIGLTLYMLYFADGHLSKLLGVVTKETFTQKLTLFWLIFTFSIFPIFGVYIFAFAHYFLGFEYGINQVSSVAFMLVQMAMNVIWFAFIYRMLSKNVFSWSSALKSGFWAGVVIDITKTILLWGMSKQGGLEPFAAIMTSFIFVVLWFIVVAFVFTFCARIGYYHEFSTIFEGKGLQFLKSAGHRPLREITLVTLLEMSRRYYSNRDGVGENATGLYLTDMCRLVAITPARAKQVVEHIVDVGLVKVFTDHEREILMLNFSPERLTLNEFMNRIERSSAGTFETLDIFPANKWFWDQYGKALQRNFGSLTIYDLYNMDFKQEEATAVGANT